MTQTHKVYYMLNMIYSMEKIYQGRGVKNNENEIRDFLGGPIARILHS